MTRKPTKEAVAARNSYVESQKELAFGMQVQHSIRNAWEAGHDFAKNEFAASLTDEMTKAAPEMYQMLNDLLSNDLVSTLYNTEWHTRMEAILSRIGQREGGAR